MTDKLKNEAAERIYLQLCDDSMSEWCGEVTWCEDRVHDEDVEYVRADIVERLRAELAEKEACIEDLCTKEKNYLADLRVARKELAAIKGQDQVAWPNRCDHTIVAALQYLSRFQRPEGGNDLFNAEHLEQLADELQRMANRPLYALPVADKDAERIIETKRRVDAILSGHASDTTAVLKMVSEVFAAMAKGQS